MNESEGSKTLNTGTAEKWRAVALLSILFLAPLAGWCRYKAVQFEPEIVRLKSAQLTLQQQVQDTEAKVAIEKQRGESALQQMQSKMEAGQMAYRKNLAKKDSDIAKLRNAYFAVAAELNRKAAPAKRVKAYKPPPSYYYNYGYHSTPPPIRGSLGQEKQYPKADPYSRYWRGY
jgi:Tfp pilus assembly protein FimV